MYVIICNVCNVICRIFLFGNSCPIKMSELKPLPAYLALLPPLAYRCTLGGIDSTECDLTDGLVELSWMSTSVTAQFNGSFAKV